MDMEIRRLCVEEGEAAFAIIEQRIAWMRERSLHQWEESDYAQIYPLAHFQRLAQEGVLYGAFAGAQLIGIIALFTQDERWDDDVPALYVHHLATLAGKRGVGERLLAFAWEIAKQSGKSRLRLDAQRGNEALNAYYERLGFRFVDSLREGAYEGNRREKICEE